MFNLKAIMAFGMAALAAVAMFFRGQALKEKVGRGEDREKIKDKAHEIKKAADGALVDGLENEAKVKAEPVDPADRDHFG